MRKIIWSHEAFKDYNQNIEYLLNQWTVQDVINFEDKVMDKLKQLQQMPLSSEATEVTGIRKAVIVKQIILYYSENEEQIELLRFWNTAKDPKGLRL